MVYQPHLAECLSYPFAIVELQTDHILLKNPFITLKLSTEGVDAKTLENVKEKARLGLCVLPDACELTNLN